MTDVMDLPGTTDEFEPQEPEALLESLDLPPGYKAELVGRQIIVTPPPGFHHETILMRINRQLYRRDWGTSGNLGVITPGGRFIPDLTVADLTYWERDSDESWQGSGGIALIVEVTPSEAARDRELKRRGYADAKVPLYLLIDRDRKESVLFSEPEKGDYAALSCRPLGEPIPLPAPFSFALEDIR